MRLEVYASYTRCQHCGIFDSDPEWCDLCGRPKDASAPIRHKPVANGTDARAATDSEPADLPLFASADNSGGNAAKKPKRASAATKSTTPRKRKLPVKKTAGNQSRRRAGKKSIKDSAGPRGKKSARKPATARKHRRRR